MKYVAIALYALGGIIFLSLIFRELAFLIRARACHTIVSGTVTDLTERRSRHGSKFAPIIDYYFDGCNYTCQIKHYYSYYKHRIGDEVTLLVDDAQPQTAILENERTASLLQLAVSTIILLFALVYAVGNLQNTF